MVVNFALTDRFDAEADDPRGRSWIGWDRSKSDDELWDVNRGDWWLNEANLADERFATLSHRGIIQVVAEITGYEVISAHPKKAKKKALRGQVLRPGDPAREALVGWSIPPQRNPVGYIDSSDVDRMTASERGRAPSERPAHAFLLTNNPDRWSWDPDDYAAAIQQTQAGRIVRAPWSTGSRNSGIEPGDRAFLLRQGQQGRGIVGSGTCTSRAFLGVHWDVDRPHDWANYVLVEWDTLLAQEIALPIERLRALPGGQNWSPQSSGTLVQPSVLPELERVWAEHLGGRDLRRSSRRQGWQMDPERRKRVEEAGQQRLMEHYRTNGWTVMDTRIGHPYDAIAQKNGEIVYLEAKGTETIGRKVIVTRGEVAHARDNPGRCVIGILSDVKFDAKGQVVEGSGAFRIFDFSPKKRELEPRDYDYGPTGQPCFEG